MRILELNGVKGVLNFGRQKVPMLEADLGRRTF
jgi:hypothetical protein